MMQLLREAKVWPELGIEPVNHLSECAAQFFLPPVLCAVT